MRPFIDRRYFTNSASFMGGFEQDSHEQGCQSLSGIPEPHENDVLMGRGGKNNQHSGNERLRKMARSVCAKYASASKKGKSEISRGLVQHVRKMKPPGRCVDFSPWIGLENTIKPRLTDRFFTGFLEGIR